MNNQKPEGLFQFLTYVQRRTAEQEVEKRLTHLYDIADDLEIHIEELELLLNELHYGIEP